MTKVQGICKIGSDFPEPDVDDDYRWFKRVSVNGVFINGVKVPYGGSRLEFQYMKKENGNANEFPVLLRKNLPMYAEMLVGSDVHYSPGQSSSNIWHFSVASLFLPFNETKAKMTEPGLAMAFDVFVSNYAAAVNSFNRDALAVIYAHLAKLMSALFNIHYRVLCTLDLRILLPYVRRIYEFGLVVAFEPTMIPLWPKLTKRIIYKCSSTTEDKDIEIGNLIEDEESEFERARDYEEDKNFDSNIMLNTSNGGNLYETLVLERIPSNEVSISTSSSSSSSSTPSTSTPRYSKVSASAIASDSGLPLASKFVKDLQLPLPSIADVKEIDWVKFAVRKGIDKFYFRENHFYCTVEMLNDVIQVYNERHKKKRYPISIRKELIAPAITDLMRNGSIYVIFDDLEFTGVVTDEMLKDNSTIKLFPAVAWKQEEEIIHGLDTYAAKAKTRSAVFKGANFCDEQIEAINRAITQPMTLITGPAGSGKTTIMETVYRLLRAKYGPGAKIMCVSFRNVIVSRLRTRLSAIDKELFPAEYKLSCTLESDLERMTIFRTCDSLIFSKVRVSPIAVIMEESGQSAAAHWQGTIRATNAATLRHFICFGDSKQRAPLKQGQPFLHALRMYPQSAWELKKVHRTNCEELLARQNAILAMDSARVLQPCVDESFQVKILDCSARRIHTGTMNIFVNAIHAELSRLDDEKTKYDDIIGLTPYNDYARIGNRVMEEYYFDGDVDYDSVFANIVNGDRRGETTVFYHGMRVAFEENTEEYSRGQVGKITHIMQGASLPTCHQVSSSNIPTSVKKTSEISFNNAAVYVKLLDTGTTAMVCCGMKGKGLATKITPASFFTVDRSQGLEFPHVLAMCPWGNNLATQDVIYTMASRAKKSFYVCGSSSHLTDMIKRQPPVKNCRMAMLYNKDVLKLK